MKYLGIILLNLSSVAAGFSIAEKLKYRCIISQELIEMCNLMAIEFSFTVTNSTKIIKRLAEEPSLSHLDFLKNFNFENIDIKTELNSSDNERINLLFNKMGKTDALSMLDLIESFKKNMQESRKKYDEYYKSHGRLYIAFGIFGGLVISLVII